MRPIDAGALFINLDGMMAVSPTGYIHGDTVADMISDAPTVKAEPEHGHWIISGEWCTCSECKQSLHYVRGKGKSNLINALSMAVYYCPNCGAKMDEKVTRKQNE